MPERPGHGDLLARGGVQVAECDAAAVGQVSGGQQGAPGEPGVDKGERLMVLDGRDGGGHVGHQVNRVLVHGSQHVRGIGPRFPALGDQPGLLHLLQGEVRQLAGAPVLGQAVAKVSQDAVVKARITGLQAERVLEAGPAAHCLGRLPVREVQHELQDADGGQLRR